MCHPVAIYAKAPHNVCVVRGYMSGRLLYQSMPFVLGSSYL